MSILDRSESRQGATVRLLAVHSTEGNDVPRVDDAAALRDAGWWTGSAHAITDNDPGSLLTPAQGCVPYDRAAWTLRSGNRVSENIEQVGWARWTRAEWLARPKLLDNTARWLADRSKARSIPLVKLSPADVAAGRSGVIGHVDWTVGMRDGSHTDPGPNYPWDVVLDKARTYAAGTDSEDDMALFNSVKDFQIAVYETQVKSLVDGQHHKLGDILQGTDANAFNAAKQTKALSGAVTALSKLVAEQNGLTLEDVRRVVAQEIAAGIDVDVTVQPGPPAS